MARINIEEKLFKDARFTELCIRFGCRFKALGALAALWMLGQEYWKKDRSLIPKPKWKEQRLPQELIDVGFVFEKGHGFEVDGAEKHFAWILQRVEAGKKGGSSDSNDLEASGVKRGEAESSGAKPLLLPLTLTLNSSSVKDVKEISPTVIYQVRNEYATDCEKIEGLLRTIYSKEVPSNIRHKVPVMLIRHNYEYSKVHEELQDLWNSLDPSIEKKTAYLNKALTERFLLNNQEVF